MDETKQITAQREETGDVASVTQRAFDTALPRDARDTLQSSLKRVERWVATRNYKSYEPFDGLNSYLRPLTCGSLLGERLLQQLVRQSPINLRPLLGIRPEESTKGRAYMAWGYLTMFRQTGEVSYRQKAEDCLQWLIRHKSTGYTDCGWGNHFDFSSRSGRIRKFEPIIPWTSLIGQVFLDAYELFRRDEHLATAESVCNWILKVPRKKTASGTCLGYTAHTETTVHGASLLGAAMLARTSKFTGNVEALEVAGEAIRYSCSRQRPDGSWYYAEEPNAEWIDSFHTAYNLDSIKCYIESTGDKRYEENLLQGFAFFKQNFFEADGRPKYYHDRVYPVDIQCASQAIDTLAYFVSYDPSSLELAVKVAQWTIAHMQDREGYFYYRQLPFIMAKTPMLHWGQATMYRALAHLLSKMAN